MNNAYVFCIMVRCGKIGKVALESYHQHHNHLVHVYCAKEDVKSIPEHQNQVLHIIDNETEIYKAFDSGHKGTAMVYAKAILESPFDKIIHFDSDVFFRTNIIDDIIAKLDDYDIVGPIRNYKHNPNNRDDVRHLPDITQTYCFGFNKKKLPTTNFETLSAMCQGSPIGLNHNIIDFFDPVAFTIINNGGKVYHIHNDVIGGCDFYGKRHNKYPETNAIYDVGDAIIHFAGIGSGMNFHTMILNNQHINVPRTYVTWCLMRYDIYSRLFFNTTIIENNENLHLIPELAKVLKPYKNIDN